MRRVVTKRFLFMMLIAFIGLGCGKGGTFVGGNQGGDQPDMADASDCVQAVDCPMLEGTIASCENGACVYVCEEGRVDTTGDVACNCQVLSATDETCDGIDDNCSGTADDDAPDAPCDNQEGVCAGATVACVDGSYSCDADLYAEHSDLYRPAADEDWLCDGLDNNCSGTADEFCCEPDVAPNPMADFGSTTARFPSITPATHEAEAGAVFLLGWIEDNEAVLQHVDEEGTAVGDARRVNVGSGANSFHLVARDSGYAFVTALSSGGASVVRYFELHADGRVSRDLSVAVVADANNLGNANVAVLDDQVCVAWSRIAGEETHVYLSCFPQAGAPDIDNISPGRIWSKPGDRFIFNRFATGPDALALAWLDLRFTKRIIVDTFDPAVPSERQTREISLGVDDEVPDFTMAALADGFGLFWSREALETSYFARLSSVGILTEPTPILPGIASFQDAIATADAVVVMWREGNLLKSGLLDPAAPGMLTPFDVKVMQLPRHARMAVGAKGVGSVWERTGSTLQFTALSHQGVPICR